MRSAQLAYSVPWYASFLHQFPRYDLTFQKANGTFDYRDQSYVESLLVLSLAVVVWLALWLLIFTLYFCYVCLTCRQEVEKTIKTRPLRWFAVALVICTCGTAAWAVYANEKTNKAFWQTDEALHRISSLAAEGSAETHRLCSRLENVTREVSSIMTGLYRPNDELHPTLLLLNDTPEAQSKAFSLFEAVRQSAGEVGNSTASFCQGVPGRSWFNASLQSLSDYNYYRWIVTLATCAWILTFCLLLWAAVACKSKWVLFTCVALAGVTMVAAWTLSAVYTALNVALADVCIDPKAAITIFANMSEREADILGYYSSCEGVAPIAQEFHGTHEKLIELGLGIKSVFLALRDDTQDYLDVRGVKEAVSNVAAALAHFYASSKDCRHYSHEFALASIALCKDGLSSLAFTLLAFCSAGSLIIAVIFLAYTVARNLGAEKAYTEVDAQDVALDTRQSPSAPTENPLYYRFSQVSSADVEPQCSSGASSAAAAVVTAAAAAENPKPPTTAAPARNGGAAAPLLQRPSPPPTYNSGEFYSTYSSNQGTLEDQRRGHSAGAAAAAS